MHNARILIVEDEGIAALDLQHRLTSMGYTVLDIVSTGEEAVAKSEEMHPDLVLMDIMLQGEIDGVTAAVDIHDRFGIPVIFLTAYADQDTLQRAKAAEPYGYLVKPVKERDLYICIDMVLYKHKMEKILKAKEEELRKAHDELQIRVRERTKELQEANEALQAEIAERKRIDEEKKQIEAQVLRAQRMESLGTLAAGIAHDLNNVLTPILMSVKLLEEEQPDLKCMKILATLEKNVRRGADLIKQVMSFARGLGGERTPIQIGHVIADIEKVISETFPRNIEIKTDVDKELFVISGDATQLQQVLMNLCINARDAMPDGGVLGISAENLFIDENLARINIEAKVGRYVVITVSDSGTGIPVEVRDRIFEPFFTTKEFGQGTGLGLSTVLGIVKSHGGFIDVHSESGRGSAFEVYLPAFGIEEAQKKLDESFEFPVGHGELVLIVDDEPQILEVARETLELFGYRVVAANNGVQAVEVYGKNKEEIGVVLMDMMMPIMDGKEAIAALSKIDPMVRVIGTSGLIESDKLMDATQKNVKAFLKKPYSAEELLKTVYKTLHIKI